ncbi:hypothetical protein TNCV_4556331 [Trichonephila clavipes]|nr:hypothetical protein TNCV_4556331 [Trichonephila clavipes]
MNTYAALFSYSRTFSDGPRNFEPWLNLIPPELPPTSPNYHTKPTGGRLSSRKIKRASLPYTADLHRYQARTHDTPSTSPLP